MNRRLLMFPTVYPWFLLMAAMDICMTWVMLSLGGVEVNYVAARMLEHNGFGGMVWLKCVSVLTVVLLCEVIGRAKRGTGLNLARGAVLTTCVPVAVAAGQLLAAGV